MRRTIFALSVAALSVGFWFTSAVPAQAVNYHNGFVLFQNDTRADVVIDYRNADAYHLCYLTISTLTFYHAARDGAKKCAEATLYDFKIPSGRSVADDKCCTVAGQTYEYRLGNQRIQVKARLCNRQGVPFGFARIRITEQGIFADNGSCPD